MQSFKGKIQHMMFEYSPKFLLSQGCTDLVARVQGLGFQVYKYGSTKKLQSELDIQIDPAELLAKREDQAVSSQSDGDGRGHGSGFRVGHGRGHGRGRGH